MKITYSCMSMPYNNQTMNMFIQCVILLTQLKITNFISVVNLHLYLVKYGEEL